MHWLCKKCQKIGKGRRSNIVPAQFPSPRASRSKLSVAVSVDNSVKKSTILKPKPLQKLKSVTIPQTDNLANITATIAELQLKYNSEISELKRILEETTRKVDKLSTVEDQVICLKSTANQLEIQTDLNERKLNSNLVEIQGLQRISTRNIKSTIESISAQIKASISLADIKHCYDKLAPPNSKISDKLVIEFHSSEVKQSFIAKGKAFTRSGQQFEEQNKLHTIYINDKLTGYQKKLLFEAKQLAKLNKFEFVWVYNSQVLIKENQQSLPVIIKTFDDLDAHFNQSSQSSQ